MKLVAPDLVRVPATMPTIWPLLDEAELLEHLFGHVDELVGVAEAVAEDGVGAPEQHGAVDDLLEGREGEDGWLGVVLGEQAGGGAGLGEDGDGGEVEVFGGVGHALADGLGDGEAGGAVDERRGWGRCGSGARSR